MEILKAAKTLVSENGLGVTDSPAARSILRSPNPSVRQVRSLWTILGKYRERLLGFGVDYEKLVPPEIGSLHEKTVPSAAVRLVPVDTERGHEVAVLFAYDHAIMETVKAARRKWFDKDGKNSGGFKNAWILPLDLDEVEKLLRRLNRISVSWAVDPGVAGPLKREREQRKVNLVESRAETADLDVPTKKPLYPFQRAGVKWIDVHGGRALVFDDQGVGKTPQALGWLLLHPEALPALVVCPSSVRANWKLIAEDFTNFKTLIMTAKSSLKAFLAVGLPASDRPDDGYELTVVNYDLFRSIETEESKKAREKAKLDPTKPQPRKEYDHTLGGLPMSAYKKFKTIIYDEIHKLKDGGSQRGRAGKALAHGKPYVIGLSGTPMPNRPIELFNPVKIVRPNTFPDYIEFGTKFCAGYQNRFGWDFSGSSNLNLLDEVLRSKGGMIRRLKTDVLKELPPKTRITIPIVIEKGLAEYKKVAGPIMEKLAEHKVEREEWRKTLEGMTPADRKRYLAAHAEEAVRKHKLTSYMLDEIEKVKQAAVHAKFEPMMELWLDIHESKKKLLLFTTHRKSVV